MDLLSITAGVITVVTFAGHTVEVFSKLRALYVSLSEKLQALNNKVADIQVILGHAQSVLNDRALQLSFKHAQTNILHLLKQASRKLTELQYIIDRLITRCGSTTAQLLRLRDWRNKRDRLQALQDDIKAVKCSLNIMLVASNS